jgi:hypothetical protein
VIQVDAIGQEFVRLCDVAIEEADKMVNQLRQQNAERPLLNIAELTLSILRGIKESAIQGILRRPSGGAGLMGLTREVGEWADGTPLMDAAYALDVFYQDKM